MLREQRLNISWDSHPCNRNGKGRGRLRFYHDLEQPSFALAILLQPGYSAFNVCADFQPADPVPASGVCAVVRFHGRRLVANKDSASTKTHIAKALWVFVFFVPKIEDWRW